MWKKMLPALAFCASALGLSLPAQADDYGCKVMLCMSNPAGPMAVGECRPPIQRLLEERARKSPPAWPTCEEAAPSTMQFTSRPYDRCPEGTTALEEGRHAIQMSALNFGVVYTTASQTKTDPLTVVSSTLPPGSVAVVGIGEGAEDSGGNKICVAKPLGQLQIEAMNESGEMTRTTYPVYVQVATLSKPGSPRVADIYVDGKLLKSTRF